MNFFVGNADQTATSASDEIFMNRLLRTIATAMLIACCALPAPAEDLPKFSDHKVKVYTGKRAKPRLDHEFWRDQSHTYRAAMRDDNVNAGGRFIVGLGDSTESPRVRVVWPTGETEEWAAVAIDRYTTLVQGSGK